MINFLKKLLSKTINYTYNLRLRKCTVHYVQYSCLQLNSHKLLPACRLGSYPVQINIVLHLGAFKLYYNMHLEILKNFHLENRFFVSCISLRYKKVTVCLLKNINRKEIWVVSKYVTKRFLFIFKF